MKAPRFITEYANFEIKSREQLIKEYGNKEDFPNFPTKQIQKEIEIIKRLAKKCVIGIITPRETMKAIATIGEEAG